MSLNLQNCGKPSALGKKIMHLICPGAKPFESCHCSKTVYGMWVSKMTPPIKSAIARIKFGADTYKEIFDTADKVHLANGGSDVPTVVAAVAEPSQPGSAPTDPSNPQVSATTYRGRGRGGFNRGNRGNRGGRGTGRGGQNNQQNQSQNQNQNSNNSSSSYVQKPHQKGPRHPDGPPNSSCSRHWSQGRSATYCSDPLVCGWASIIAPRQKNNTN